MDIHNIKQEGEVYARQARMQLSLLSYLKICLIMAIGWAGVDAVIGMFTVQMQVPATQPESFFAYIWIVCMYVAFGFAKAMFCGVISYPLYRWWCQRHRGQRLAGKFALIIES